MSPEVVSRERIEPSGDRIFAEPRFRTGGGSNLAVTCEERRLRLLAGAVTATAERARARSGARGCGDDDVFASSRRSLRVSKAPPPPVRFVGTSRASATNPFVGAAGFYHRTAYRRLVGAVLEDDTVPQSARAALLGAWPPRDLLLPLLPALLSPRSPIGHRAVDAARPPSPASFSTAETNKTLMVGDRLTDNR